MNHAIVLALVFHTGGNMAPRLPILHESLVQIAMATLGGVSVSFALHQFILESVSIGLFQVSFEFSLFLFVFTSLLFSISLFLPVSSVYRFLFGLAGNFYGFSGLLFPLISLLYLFYFFFAQREQTIAEWMVPQGLLTTLEQSWRDSLRHEAHQLTDSIERRQEKESFPAVGNRQTRYKSLTENPIRITGAVQ